MSRPPAATGWLAAALIGLALFVSGCGRTLPPIQPGVLPPPAVADLAHEVREDEILLFWNMPAFNPVFVASLAGTIPLVLATERTGHGRALFTAAILMVAIAQALLGFDHGHVWAVLVSLTVFFAGFNYLEARLPAQLTHADPGTERGAALGIFATAQFLGAFLGGALGGVLLGRFGLAGSSGAARASRCSGPCSPPRPAGAVHFGVNTVDCGITAWATRLSGIRQRNKLNSMKDSGQAGMTEFEYLLTGLIDKFF